MTGTDLVTLEFQNGVAAITIQREAALNALSTEVLQGLSKAISAIDTRTKGPSAYDECRVAVIRGAGDKAFVAGADIKAMQSASEPELKSFVSLGQQVMRGIELLPLPVLAVVQGFAIGGGMELALACDLILAGEQAQFGQAEVKLGLIPGFGGSQRLISRVGLGVARRLVLTGDNVSASEALRMGLVDYLVPNAELPLHTEKVCASLMARSPIALSSAKRAMDHFYQQNLAAGLSNEITEFLYSAQSADAKEGMQAFLEKRKPMFRGKYG